MSGLRDGLATGERILMSDHDDIDRALGDASFRLDPRHLERAVREVHARRANEGEVTPLDLILQGERGSVHQAVVDEWRQITEVARRDPFPWSMDHVMLAYWQAVWGEEPEGV